MLIFFEKAMRKKITVCMRSLVSYLLGLLLSFATIANAQSTLGPVRASNLSTCTAGVNPNINVSLSLANNQIIVNIAGVGNVPFYYAPRGFTYAFYDLSNVYGPNLGAANLTTTGNGNASAASFTLSPLTTFYGRILYIVIPSVFIDPGTVRVTSCGVYAAFQIPAAPPSPTTVSFEVRDQNNNIPTQADVGNAIGLAAFASPVGVGGFFNFYNGVLRIASNVSPDTGGVAVSSYIFSDLGVNRFRAEFFPASSTYTSSGSNAINVLVYQPTQVNATLTNPVLAGKPFTVTAAVTGGGPVGDVTVKLNGVIAKSGVQLGSSGTVAIALPALKVGPHSLTVDYVPTAGTYYKPSSSVALKINAIDLSVAAVLLQLLLDD